MEETTTASWLEERLDADAPVLIVGDAMSGKTRLLMELAARATMRQENVVIAMTEDELHAECVFKMDFDSDSHYVTWVGMEESNGQLVSAAIETNATLVVVEHPSGLTLKALRKLGIKVVAECRTRKTGEAQIALGSSNEAFAAARRVFALEGGKLREVKSNVGSLEQQ